MEVVQELLSTPKCCKEKHNLEIEKSLKEGSKNYIWLRCKKCASIYLKKEKKMT